MSEGEVSKLLKEQYEQAARIRAKEIGLDADAWAQLCQLGRTNAFAQACVTMVEQNESIRGDRYRNRSPRVVDFPGVTTRLLPDHGPVPVAHMLTRLLAMMMTELDSTKKAQIEHMEHCGRPEWMEPTFPSEKE